MKKAIFPIILIALFAAVPALAAQAENAGQFSLETGMDYNSGKYGRATATDILYLPVTGKYQGESWTLKMTVPYLRITGPGNVVNGIGQAGGAATNTSTTRSGLGDVVMAATRNIVKDGSSGFMVNLTGKLKLGTADSAQGLGTGQNDYALQADLYQMTGNMTTFGTFGYRINGGPAAYSLNNVLYGSLGEAYKYDQAISGGILLNLSQKVVTTGSSHVEAIAFASNKLNRSWKVQGYLLKGFTNSVPDWGGGVSVAYHFE